MKDIISIHVGQAGIRMGQSQWELLCQEHNIGSDGYHTQESQYDLENTKSMFYESISGKKTPRAVFYDLEPDAIEKV